MVDSGSLKGRNMRVLAIIYSNPDKTISELHKTYQKVHNSTIERNEFAKTVSHLVYVAGIVSQGPERLPECNNVLEIEHYYNGHLPQKKAKKPTRKELENQILKLNARIQELEAILNAERLHSQQSLF